MIRPYSPIRLLVLVGLLLTATQLALAQSRAIQPVKLQIPDEGEVQLYQGSHALVIGVSDYQDNAWVDLNSVGVDVKEVRETLEEQGFVVETLMNPTKNRLLNGITDFIDTHGYEQENRLLFYYSGHGYTQERNGRKFGYLVPVDAPNPYDNERAFFYKSLKMVQVLSWAKQIESKHVMFVFDSSFSDSVLQSSEVPSPDDISYQPPKPVRQFISSGSASQTVADKGVFRPLFIRGIKGEADLNQDGYVTGTELGMYLQQQVPQFQTGQSPYYGKLPDPDNEGNFVFEAISSNQPKLKIMKLYIGVDDFLADLDSHQTSWKTIKSPDRYLVYVGEVRNGLPNGKGTYTDPDGFKYFGELKNGKLHGQGMLAAPHGDQYIGQYKDGKLHGKGTYTWPNGERYVGSFKANKFHWQGTHLWPNGERYVGNHKDGLAEGQGTFTWPDGEKYVGNHKNDLAHGQGTHTWPDGRFLRGIWEEGTFIGERPVRRQQPITEYVWRPKAAQNEMQRTIDCEDCDYKKANFTEQQGLLKSNALKSYQQQPRRLPIPEWSLAEQNPIEVSSTLLSR